MGPRLFHLYYSHSARVLQHPINVTVVSQSERDGALVAADLRAEALAIEVDVSKSYLAKLFRKTCGDTVAGYIFARRTARAFHMLANTTMPIKAIAYAVGMPDLQQFNKAIRRRYGRSPRSVRALGGE